MAQTVQNYFSLKTPRPKKGKKLANSELIGVEVELEHVKIRDVFDWPWQVQEDHSLKKQGKEFTLLVYHNYAKIAIRNLLESTLSKPTQRCGIHVHINAQDLTLEEIQVFLMYYMVFERALYKYSGKRWTNIFCVPLREWMLSLDFDLLSNLVDMWQKYSGLNLLTLRELGTIEFRQMVSSHNATYIQGWINMIVALKQASKGKNKDDVIQQITELNGTSGYWHLMQQIFGDLAYALQYANLKDDLEDCIAHTKLCLCTPQHYQGV